jgi:hypothetical protein
MLRRERGCLDGSVLSHQLRLDQVRAFLRDVVSC